MNENQTEAVQWNVGPLLVLAGPGSGKTRVLTYRIARLLSESSSERFKILGVTFTNKAAAEMRNRLDVLLNSGKERAILTTFHSLAADILRQHGHHLEIRPDFTILVEQADREAVISEALLDVNDDFEDLISGQGNLLQALDKILGESVDLSEVTERLEGHTHKELLSQLFVAYRRKMIAGNHLDFPSLIGLAVQLLETRPAIAKQFQKVYRYVCVDEFQDTNGTQFRLLCALVPMENPNLFVVADDDQLIYQWNGADPRRLPCLVERFRMATVQLPENYRCPPIVIELANNLISHNLDRSEGKKPLVAHKNGEADDQFRLQQFDNFAEEVAWIVEDLKRRSAVDRNDCVVLGRNKKLLLEVVDAANELGIAAHIAERKTQFISAPVSWLHAVLRLANSRQDKEQLRRVCKAFYSLEGINTRVEDVLAAASFQNGDCLRAWIDTMLATNRLSASSRQMLEASKSTILERGDQWPFIDAAFSWFDGINDNLDTPKEVFDEYEDEKAVWCQIQSEIIGHAGRGEVSLHALLQEFDLRSKETPPPKEAVRCMTIHASKGMEFKHVYLAGLVEDQLPSWAAVKKGDESLEIREERRNCFVAITRAEESLTLTYSDRYYGWGKRPSRFLYEMGIIG